MSIERKAAEEREGALKQRERTTFWVYVTMFGTLWGGLELTLGTFLHVLHVPKSGLIMTVLSCIMMIALRVLYPKRGATLGAAIIASCIKCLSPGGIILGPVIGIISEAAMIELGLLISSSSPITAILAGILAVFSCQFQSLFKMWIYYGNDFFNAIFKVAENFFDVKETATIAFLLIGGLLSILAAIGGVAGIIGWIWGRRVVHRLESDKTSTCLPAVSNEDPAFADTLNEPNSGATLDSYRPKTKRDPKDTAQIVKTRFICLPFAVAAIAVQFVEYGAFKGMFPVLAAFAVWLVVLAVWARPVLKAIWWPKFWVLTAVVSLIAGAILACEFVDANQAVDAAKAGGEVVQAKGAAKYAANEAGMLQFGSLRIHLLWALNATVSMMARGAFVFALVSWATRCIRTTEFYSICNKLHMPELGQSLNQAYEILPTWLERFNDMLRTRPSGLRATLKYIRMSAFEVLVQASHEAENRLNADSLSTQARNSDKP